MASVCSYGQSNAVRASINILPPYSVYLSDYVAPGSSKIQISINVTDPNPDDLAAKLRITIEGEGITIISKPNYMPSPIRLTTGINTITTADLAPYFDPANLNFQGLDKSQFIKSGRLKEGIYQFCVEAVEYNRNIKLSEKSCATAWLLLNNPPQWNLPQANELIKASNPQNIMFNWIPQHTGSPNAAFTTEYEFTLVEIWPDNRNPNDAINSQLPLFRTTTSTTSLFYDPAEPQLIPGHKYAIRLKAYDKEGRDLFINSGYSEVRVFTFGEVCKPPTSEKSTIENFQKAKIEWLGLPAHSDYTIRYRPYSKNSNMPWYYKNSLLEYVYLDTLTANTQYEYSIKANCSSIASDYSQALFFTLPTMPANTFECKDEVYIPAPAYAAAKKEIRIGEKVNVGGYTMEITEIKTDMSLWTGKGVIVVPFLNNIRLATHFTQILINENNEVTSGQVHTDRATLNVTDIETKAQITEMLDGVEKGITSADKYIDNANSIIKETENIIKQAPEVAKRLLEKGKQEIEKGKQLIANGDTEGGKALIEKGKGLIKDGIGKIKEGVGNLPEDVSQLKDLFKKAIQNRLDALIKDSSQLIKAMVVDNNLYQQLKKQYELELYESTEISMWSDETTALIDESIILEVIGEDELPNTSKTSLLNKLNSASTNRYKFYSEWDDIMEALKLLESYKLPDESSLSILIQDFKKESVSLLKKYALDALTGKQKEELDIQIKKFIDTKIEAAITLVKK